MQSDAVSGYDYFDVEADIGIHAWGPTPAEAFAQVALGVLALIVAPEDVAPRETREVRAQGQSAASLLVNWINECIYVHEIEGFVVRRIEIVGYRDASLIHGVLHGEELDPHRHRPGTIVKAATFHQASTTAGTGRYDVKVIVDV